MDITIEFAFKKIIHQQDYIKEIEFSNRTPERKKELIDSADGLRNKWIQKYYELLDNCGGIILNPQRK